MREGTGGPTPARPRQVTVAGVVAALSCALLVLTLFEVMAQVRSSETRDSVQSFLSTYPGDQLGLGVDRAVGFLRGLVLLSGGLAAAGVILAVYVLRRHRGARVGLAVVAALMLFSTTFVSGLLPLVVAFAAATLWRREARDWFDGRSPARPGPVGERPGPTTAAWEPPASVPLAELPPPTMRAGPGAPPSPVDAGWAPPAVPGRLPGSVPDAARRPTPVTVAVWLTWVAAGLTTLLLGWLVVVLLVDRADLLSSLREEPSLAQLAPTDDDLMRALWLIAAFGITWSLAAMALAALALHRVRAGRTGLVVSSALTAVVGSVTIVLGALGLATLVLLLLPRVGRWYAGAAGPGSLLPPPPTQPPAAGPPSPSDSGRPPVW